MYERSRLTLLVTMLIPLASAPACHSNGASQQGDQVDANTATADGFGVEPGCFIMSVHEPEGAVDPEDACEVCDPTRSTSAWSSASDGTSCGQGGTCTQGGCACPSGTLTCGDQCVDPTSNDHCGQCGVTCTGSTTCYQESCQIIPAAMPTARSALTVTAGSDGRIYALGGWNGGDALLGHTFATLEIYAATTNTWTTGAPMPTSRNLHATAANDGHLYAMGGSVGSLDPPIATLEIYDIATDTWTTGAPMPTARMSLCAARGSDGRIYAIGGGNEGYPDGTYVETGAVEAYTPSTNTWTAVASLPTARARLSCAVGTDGRIYAIGGAGASGQTDVVEAYDIPTNTWTTVAALPLVLQQFAAVTGPSGKIYAVGGMSGLQYVAEVYAYDLVTKAWMLDSALTPARSLFGAALGGNSKMYAIGGYDGQDVLSTVATYTAIDSWIP